MQPVHDDDTAALQGLLNAIAEPVCGLDGAGKVVLCNDACWRETGYRADEMLGNSLHQLVHPCNGVTGQTSECLLCRLPNHQQELHLVGATLRRKDGRQFPADYWLRPTQSRSSRAEWIVTFCDIGDRMRAEEALRWTQDVLDESQKQMHIGSWSWKMNQRETVYWSAEHHRIFGGEPRTGELGLEESLQGIHPEDRARFRQLVRDSIAAKRGYETELRIIRPDGTVRNIRGVGNPLFDQQGNVIELVGTTTDITEQKRAESALRASERRYRLLFERNLAGVLRTSLEGRILECNQATADILGYGSPEELVAVTASSFYESPSDRDLLIQELRSKKSLSNREMKFRCKNGEFAYVLANFSLIEDDPESEPLIEWTLVDISERKVAEARAQALAYYDPLTALPNRTLLRDRLSQALALARRHNHKVAVFFIDLDRFKVINDSLGHSIGDLLLKEVALRLKKCLRETDSVARLGGDEFVVVLSHLREVHEATTVAQRLLKAVAATFDIQGNMLNISCSLGVSIYPEHGSDSETLIKNADAAMYMAKETGRNHSQLFTPDLSASAVQRLTLESGLRLALQRGEFFLNYQPQMEIATGRITGLEALLRWQHPQLGLVPPNQFIEVAETTGLIVRIGEWVLSTACCDARQWQTAGLLSAPVAVNVSALQLRQVGFCKMVGTVLKEAGLAPEYLQLELTETTLLANADLMLSVLQELKAMGVTLAIDDFGTGYSSFSYLRKIRFDKFKIDGVFIRDVAENPDDASITSAIISMAKNLRLKVIAEGVEKEAQLSFLRANRCDEIQGYYFCRPLSAAGISEFLSNRSSQCTLGTRGNLSQT